MNAVRKKEHADAFLGLSQLTILTCLVPNSLSCRGGPRELQPVGDQILKCIFREIWRKRERDFFCSMSTGKRWISSVLCRREIDGFLLFASQLCC